MATNHANRGKVAEKKVVDWLKALNERKAAFAWHRLPDARAARGYLAAQPCDFLVFSSGVATLLEVKEIAHDYRVPHDKISQLSTLKKFQLAGCRAAILVYHTPSKVWRCMDAQDLETITKGSWDLREHLTHPTCEEAFIARFSI